MRPYGKKPWRVVWESGYDAPGPRGYIGTLVHLYRVLIQYSESRDDVSATHRRRRNATSFGWAAPRTSVVNGKSRTFWKVPSFWKIKWPQVVGCQHQLGCNSQYNSGVKLFSSPRSILVILNENYFRCFPLLNDVQSWDDSHSPIGLHDVY